MDLEEDTNDAGAGYRSVDQVRRELDGKPDRDYDSQPRRRTRNRPPRSGFPTRTQKKHPQASERSSLLAQRWMDAGSAAGFEFPYDVNFFALSLQRKVEGDKAMRDLLLKEDYDKVERWVAKMVERWWAEYVSNEITAANAKDYFLVTDWDDLREYARTCLRAAYLLKHGRRVTPSVEALAAGRELHDRLAEKSRETEVSNYVEQVLTTEEQPLELDPKGRDRLRSWREKRRNK